MVVENSKSIINLRIKLFAVTVLFIVYIILAYFAKVIKFPLLGLSDTFWTLILIFLYFCYLIYPMVLNYQYIYYSDEEDKIIFRYFIAGIVGGRKNSIEIYKSLYAGYRRDKKFFGLIQSVTLFQYVKGGIAKYPRVYISLLNSEERSKVLYSLYKHAPAEAKEITE
ncbi:MAG: hypothetical protein ACUVTX_03435 [Bacteroidales bacterium]